MLLLRNSKERRYAAPSLYDRVPMNATSFLPDGHALVDHYLRGFLQTVFSAWWVMDTQQGAVTSVLDTGNTVTLVLVGLIGLNH